MASSVPPMPNYMHVIVRQKMTESTNSIPSGLLCHYGENGDVFPIGGLIEPNETLVGSAIRHCRHLVNYRVRPNDRLYLAKMLNGFMNHEPVKIYIHVTNVLERDFRWRGRHNTRAMAKKVVDHLNQIEQSYAGLPCPLPPVAVPTS